jgi:hypothetical protein
MIGQSSRDFPPGADVSSVCHAVALRQEHADLVAGQKKPRVDCVTVCAGAGKSGIDLAGGSGESFSEAQTTFPATGGESRLLHQSPLRHPVP